MFGFEVLMQSILFICFYTVVMNTKKIFLFLLFGEWWSNENNLVDKGSDKLLITDGDNSVIMKPSDS